MSISVQATRTLLSRSKVKSGAAALFLLSSTHRYFIWSHDSVKSMVAVIPIRVWVFPASTSITCNKKVSSKYHLCLSIQWSTWCLLANTLLKSDVTRRDHVVRCHGSHECWFTHRQFHSQFHSRWHSLRITLKSTTLVCMRSSNLWTTKSLQRSEWRLGFNSVSANIFK